MHGRVADHALLPYLLPPGLELGLHQAGHLAVRLQHRVDSGEDQFQGDETHVDRGKIQLVRNDGMVQVAGIGPLQADHPLVLAELPCKLAVAHVHGVDLLCAVLQHAVGKAAGGGPDIPADAACQGDGEGGHGLLQLEAAPAHIAQGIAPDLDLRRLVHGGAGLVRPLALHEDQTAHNGGLGLLPALLQSPLHQQHIQSLLHGAITSLTSAAMPWRSNPNRSQS